MLKTLHASQNRCTQEMGALSLTCKLVVRGTQARKIGQHSQLPRDRTYTEEEVGLMFQVQEVQQIKGNLQYP